MAKMANDDNSSLFLMDNVTKVCPVPIFIEESGKSEEYRGTLSNTPLSQTNQIVCPNIREFSSDETVSSNKPPKLELEDKLEFLRYLRKGIKMEPADYYSSVESVPYFTEAVYVTNMTANEEVSMNHCTTPMHNASIQKRNLRNCEGREVFATDILYYFNVVSELHTHELEGAAKCISKYKPKTNIIFCSSALENQQRAPRPPNSMMLFEKKAENPSSSDPGEESMSRVGFRSEETPRVMAELSSQIPANISAIPKQSLTSVHHSYVENQTARVCQISELYAAFPSPAIPSASHPQDDRNVKIASVADSVPFTEQLQESHKYCSFKNTCNNIPPESAHTKRRESRSVNTHPIRKRMRAADFFQRDL